MDLNLLLHPLISLLLISTISATKITLHNKCNHPVWPAIQPGAGQPVLRCGGFHLPAGQTTTIRLPPLWSGRLWGRHGCNFDANGKGSCATGDCGGSLYCNGLGGAPPATLAEITLGAEQDFYDVSLVDGYNLPISILPVRGKGRCSYAGCVHDLNVMCPVALQVRSQEKGSVVACKSACLTFNSPRYCCTGEFGSPQSCKPTSYSKIFIKRLFPNSVLMSGDIIERQVETLSENLQEQLVVSLEDEEWERMQMEPRST